MRLCSPCRGCLEFATRRGQPLGGVRVSAELWTGEEMRSSALPETEAIDCVPFLPDSIKASARGLDRTEASPYADAWQICPPLDLERAPYDERRIPRRGRDRAFCARQRPAVMRVDTTGGRVSIANQFELPDRWAQAARRNPGPVIMPPDRYTDALQRFVFHADLEEWWLRGGRTLGDPTRYPDRAWIWAEDDLNWYYLLGETTDRGVRAYLDLVKLHGTAIEWLVDDETARGPQQVRIGPERVLIPGFFFHRWRN